MSKVYVVEVPARRNTNGSFTNVRDISDAHRFGQVIILLPPADEDDKPFDIVSAQKRISAGLQGFDHKRDYLLCGMGHPLAIACAISEVARSGAGKLRLLHWDSRRRAYGPVFLDSWAPLADQSVIYENKYIDGSIGR